MVKCLIKSSCCQEDQSAKRAETFPFPTSALLLYLIIDNSRDRLQNRKMLIEEPEVLKQWLTTHLEPL